MALLLTCSCGSKVLVDAAKSGPSARCPDCGNSIRVPVDRGGRAMPVPLVSLPVPVADPPARKSRPAPAPRRAEPEPPERRSPWTLILGLLALAVLAGILLWLWLGGKAVDPIVPIDPTPIAPAAPTAVPKVIDDLALVPADAARIVCSKPAAILKVESARKAIADERKRDPNRPDLIARMENESGLKGKDIERVTRVSLGGTEDLSWAVFKTTAPVDPAALRGRLRNPRQKTHLDYPVFTGTDAEGRSVAVGLASPTVLVIGSEAAVQHALGLIARPVVEGPLKPAVEMCRKDSHGILGYHPSKRAAAGDLFGLDLSRLTDIEAVFNTIDLREKKVEGKLRLRTVNKEKAADTLGVVNDWVKTMRFPLLFTKNLPGEQGRRNMQYDTLLANLRFALENEDIVGSVEIAPEVGAVLYSLAN